MLRKIWRKLFRRGTPPCVIERTPRCSYFVLKTRTSKRQLKYARAAGAIGRRAAAFGAGTRTPIRWTIASVRFGQRHSCGIRASAEGSAQKHFTLRHGTMPIREHPQKNVRVPKQCSADFDGCDNSSRLLARSERFELPTLRFEV